MFEVEGQLDKKSYSCESEERVWRIESQRECDNQTRRQRGAVNEKER